MPKKCLERRNVFLLFLCMFLCSVFCARCAAVEVSGGSLAVPRAALLSDDVTKEFSDAALQEGVLKSYSCSGTVQPITVFPVVGGVLTVSTSGSYYFPADMTADVSITAADVCLTLSSHVLTGRLLISAADAIVADGTIATPAATDNTQALDAAVSIAVAGSRAQMIDLTVTCATLPDRTSESDPDGINGRLAVQNAASNVQIRGCTIAAAWGQGFNVYKSGFSDELWLNKNTGAGGVSISNSGANILIEDCILNAGSGGQLRGELGLFSVSLNIGSSQASTMHGGIGILNTGINAVVDSCSIQGGSGGNVSGTVVSQPLNIGYSGNVTVGAGGAGISNAGSGIRIRGCSKVAGGAAGYVAAACPLGGANGRIQIGIVTIGDGGSGIANEGEYGDLLNNNISGGNGGGISASLQISTDVHPLRIVSANMGGGGTGIYNTGMALCITSCAVFAGSGGEIYAYGSTNYQGGVNITLDTVTTGFGGNGVSNSGLGLVISGGLISAGSGGWGTASTNSGSGGLYTITIGAGGSAVSDSGSNSLISSSCLTSANGGSVSVTANLKNGSANGAVGGHGLLCTGSASNICMSNSLVIQTGTGGRGYNATGGNGGNGIQIDNTCSNIQISMSRIQVLGAGGGSDGGSSGSAGKFLVNGSNTCPLSSRSLIFSCDPSLTAPRDIYYYKKQ